MKSGFQAEGIEDAEIWKQETANYILSALQGLTKFLSSSELFH